MSQMFQREVWLPFLPDTLYTLDDFIDDVSYTKKGKLNRKILLYVFLFFCRCTVCLRMDGGHTSY